MKHFTINGKDYRSKEIDFNFVCDLEDNGVSLASANEKPMSMVRAYFALCAGRNKEYAGKEMQEHVLNGGDFDEIMEVMGAEMEASGFFQALSKKKEEETAEDEKEQTKKK